MNLEQYINFEGNSFNELFKVTEEEASNASYIISKTIGAIVKNSDYYIENKTDNSFDLHRGRILKKLFEAIEDERERLIAIASIDEILDLVAEGIQMIHDGRLKL